MAIEQKNSLFWPSAPPPILAGASFVRLLESGFSLERSDQAILTGSLLSIWYAYEPGAVRKLKILQKNVSSTRLEYTEQMFYCQVPILLSPTDSLTAGRFWSPSAR
jgi:hypothetical protein